MSSAEAELARAKARVMADVAETLRDAARTLSSSDGGTDWRGPTQRAFDDALLRQVGRLRGLAASSDVASNALLGIAAGLEVS